MFLTLVATPRTGAGPPPSTSRASTQPAAPAESCPAPGTPKGCALLKAGRARLAAADPEGAIACLTQAVQERPEDAACALALAAAYRAANRPEQAERLLGRTVRRFPANAALQMAWIDAALERHHYATALARLGTLATRLQQTPEMHWRAAQAYFHLGQDLGGARVRTVRGGRAGQFRGPWLLVEPREAAGRFLCCPRESALYQLRRALDGGLDRPGAYVLYARIWQRLRRPEIGLAVLRSREAVLLAEPTAEVLAAFSDLALAADALPDYLRYERLRARQWPSRADEILFAAFLTLAERYSQRGEEALYVQWLRRAAERRPDDVGVLVRLADAEWAAGQPRRAAEYYRRVLQKDSDHPQRVRMLNRIGAATDAPD